MDGNTRGWNISNFLVITLETETKKRAVRNGSFDLKICFMLREQLQRRRPFGPSSIENSTTCPCFRVRKPSDWIAEK